MDSNDEQKFEMEDQFILRLPAEHAQYVRDLLKNKPKKLKKRFGIDLDPTNNTATVVVNKTVLVGTLNKFPTVIESYKTYDKVNLLKTADICQILNCQNTDENDNRGLAPPLKNAKTRRFRKCLINKDENTSHIQKELFYLLQADMEAVSSKYEIIEAENNDNKTNCERLFGNISSDSEDTLSNVEEIPGN